MERCREETVGCREAALQMVVSVGDWWWMMFGGATGQCDEIGGCWRAAPVLHRHRRGRRRDRHQPRQAETR